MHLIRPGLDRGEGVRDGEPEVVVTVHRNGDPGGQRSAYRANARGELAGLRVPDGVGDVHRGGPGLDGDLVRAAQEVHIGTRGVLGRELDTVAARPRAAHRDVGAAQALVARDAELAIEVDVGRRDEDVERRGLRGGKGAAGDVDVLVDRAGQRRYRGAANARRDVPDGLGLAD